MSMYRCGGGSDINDVTQHLGGLSGTGYITYTVVGVTADITYRLGYSTGGCAIYHNDTLIVEDKAGSGVTEYKSGTFTAKRYDVIKVRAQYGGTFDIAEHF